MTPSRCELRGSRAARIVVAASVALLGAAVGTPARSADTGPDLSGFWLRVGNLAFDAILDDDEGKPIARLQPKRPDAEEIWAGDSDNPILQPWAREIVKKNADSEMRRQHVYTADDSCWPSGVPQVVNLLDGVEFLQLKDRIVIIYQRDHQVRWVWLDRGHSADPAPSWYGESVGHYEGETLVIDTIGQKAHKMSVVDPFGTPHTDKIHVVERYQPFSDPFGRGLEVTVRVEAPAPSPGRGRAPRNIARTPRFIRFKRWCAPKTIATLPKARLSAQFRGKRPRPSEAAASAEPHKRAAH
jgi:hypothetical protein